MFCDAYAIRALALRRVPRIFLDIQYILEKRFPLQGERAHSLKNFVQIKSKSCLQGQPELCGSYHLLQSCFSFFRLHGQPSCLVAASFSSLALLSSSVSTANLSCLLATTFSSLSLLSNSFSSPRFNFLRMASRSFSWSSVSDDLFFSSCSFWVLLLALSFARLIRSLSLLCSSVSGLHNSAHAF